MLQLINAPPCARHRTFRSAWFTKVAHKRRISDAVLCKAAAEVRKGQAVNLGGGVWKKRLNDNLDRSIILAQDGTRWFFVYLFMKKDRDNISLAEERKFKLMALSLGRLSDGELDDLLKQKEFVEICHEDLG